MTRYLLAVLMLTGGIFAADQVPAVDQRHLEAVAHRWQHTLKLDDWTVGVSVVRAEDLPDGAWGASRAFASIRSLLIRVLDPRDYDSVAKENGIRPKRGREITRDIEDTILHELLHLRLRDLVQAESPTEVRATEEVTVDRITKAMLSLHREK